MGAQVKTTLIYFFGNIWSVKQKVRFTTSHLCVNQEKVPVGMATEKQNKKLR